METKNPIIVALDVNTMSQAQKLVDELSPVVGGFKVGLELFVSEGALPTTGLPIVLDLKLHDIPNTVEAAVLAMARRNRGYVRGMTLHIQQKETLKRAVDAANSLDLTLFGVTVLTSLTDEDCYDLRFTTGSEQRASYLAKFGYEAGLRSFVCSPAEVGKLRQAHPDASFLVPGIRPAGADVGDQKRVGTPKAALDAGATFLVIGRPITQAKSPREAAEAILESLG